METNVAGVTVKVVEPPMLAATAVIVVWPVDKLVASPLALAVATDGADELQWAEWVTSCVEPSVKVPTAVNVWFIPNGIAAVAGLTVIETTEAGVTVSSVDPLVPPRVAVMVAVPVAREVPSALELTVATTVLLEPQVVEVVRS